MPVRDSNMTVLMNEAMRKQFHSCAEIIDNLCLFRTPRSATPTKENERPEEYFPKEFTGSYNCKSPRLISRREHTIQICKTKCVLESTEMKDYSPLCPQLNPADWDLVIQRQFRRVVRSTNYGVKWMEVQSLVLSFTS